MANLTGDFVSFGECRLKNYRVVDIKKNNEKVGEKHLVDVVTWGASYTVEVNPDYAKSLQYGKTGRAWISAEFDADKQIREFAGRAYNKDVYLFTDGKLSAFEVAK
jgi:hypothetical protein